MNKHGTYHTWYGIYHMYIMVYHMAYSMVYTICIHVSPCLSQRLTAFLGFRV